MSEEVHQLYPGRRQWWSIYGEDIYAALEEAVATNDPAGVFHRLYASMEHSWVSGKGEAEAPSTAGGRPGVTVDEALRLAGALAREQAREVMDWHALREAFRANDLERAAAALEELRTALAGVRSGGDEKGRLPFSRLQEIQPEAGKTPQRGPAYSGDDLRQVAVVFDTEAQFVDAIDRLQRIREAEGLETNAEALAMLLSYYAEHAEIAARA